MTFTVPLWAVLVAAVWTVAFVVTWRVAARASRGLDCFGYPAGLDLADGLLVGTLWACAVIATLALALAHAWGWL